MNPIGTGTQKNNAHQLLLRPEMTEHNCFSVSHALMSMSEEMGEKNEASITEAFQVEETACKPHEFT